MEKHSINNIKNLASKPDVNEQAIGIFDSGIGGLSVAQCIYKQLPNESFIYVADTLNAPYGEKSTSFIQQRVNTIADFFIEKNAKAIVIACNTATVNAIDQLRARVSIPVIGVEPAIKPAALISSTKKVAILVTQATANNARFLALINQYKNGSDAYIQACPGLVELIEQGQKDSAQCRQLLQSYLHPLLEKGVDTIVLGCTHYPLLIELISEICGTRVKIMETAQPVTEQLQRQLIRHQLVAANSTKRSTQFFSSETNRAQQDLFSTIWQQPVLLATL
jgi:glutamate racemase